RTPRLARVPYCTRDSSPAAQNDARCFPMRHLLPCHSEAEASAIGEESALVGKLIRCKQKQIPHCVRNDKTWRCGRSLAAFGMTRLGVVQPKKQLQSGNIPS